MNLKFGRDEKGRRKITNRQIDFLGWVLFLLSATGFIIASIGNFWSMVGSIFFFVACLVFLVPFFRPE